MQGLCQWLTMSIPIMNSVIKIIITRCQKDICQNSINHVITIQPNSGISKSHILVSVQDQHSNYFRNLGHFHYLVYGHPGKLLQVTLWKTERNTYSIHFGQFFWDLPQENLPSPYSEGSGSLNWIKLGIWISYNFSF